MTVDQLVRHLGQCRARIKTLRDDNQRLWDSREEWKRRHRERQAEIVALRKRVTRLTESRDRWRTAARDRNVKLYNYRRNNRAPWVNVHMSRPEIDWVLNGCHGTPPRD